MIDTHAHLFLSQVSAAQWVANAQAAGVTAIVNVATSLENAHDCVAMAAQFSMIYPTVGIHPCETAQPDSVYDAIFEFAQQHPVVAVGEIGLDGYRNPVSPEQITRFVRQLELARKLHLPAIIHCRNAADPLAEILSDFTDILKVIHCFSEDDRFLAQVDGPMTYYSFTGNITYGNAKNTHAAAVAIPLDKIMLETDSPYLTPQAHKGKPNESAFVGEVAARIAVLKEIPVETVIATTTQTARHFFQLPHA